MSSFDENEINPEFEQLQLNNFLIEPAEFYIEKDQVQDLSIKFKEAKINMQ